MMSREQAYIEEHKNAEEYVSKMGKLANEYKYKGVSVGVLIGCLETIKLRIFWETNERVNKELHKEEEGHREDN